MNNTKSTPSVPLALLGLGAMGTALARTWLAEGQPLVVWNRTPARAVPLAAEGATVAATPAEAVAAAELVVVCLLDDASVEDALDGVDLAGKHLVNLTTGTPEQARAREAWARERGATLLDGGIMAVPPMIGVPDSGGYVLYSGPREVFDAHREVLEAVTGARYVGADPGLAALTDVALLSAMTGMFAGVTHAFALVGKTDVDLRTFAGWLAEWLGAMAPLVHDTAAQLVAGDYTEGVVSNLEMMVAGNATLLRTAEEQGVRADLLTPFMELMERRLAAGHGDESMAGLVDQLAR